MMIPNRRTSATLVRNSVPQGFLIAFLEKLDAAPLGRPFALRSAEERDLLETYIWVLAYRMDQVSYHFSELESLLNEPIEESRSIAFTEGAEAAGAAHAEERRSAVVWDSRPAFELSAMLAAMRSGLDTLADIAATFLKGYARANNSMHTLGEKLKTYDGANLLLSFLRDEWLGWIRDCKEYRDDLVLRHRGPDRFEHGVGAREL